MRILRNIQTEWKTTCPDCGALLAYTDADVGYYGMVTRIVGCPCGTHVTVPGCIEQRTPLTLVETCSRWERVE